MCSKLAAVFFTGILVIFSSSSQVIEGNSQLMSTPAEKSYNGPLIIDYPFSIHHSTPSQSSNQFIQHQLKHKLHAPFSEPHEKFSSWVPNHESMGTSSNYIVAKKKKKKKHEKGHFKILVPLLVALTAKVAHLLPLLKFTLLALFSLLLFAKKAFLISVGTILLVIYDHITTRYWDPKGGTSGINSWKDKAPPHNNFNDVKTGTDWWRSETPNDTDISPRESEKWKRWWTPQIKSSNFLRQIPPQLEQEAAIRKRIGLKNEDLHVK